MKKVLKTIIAAAILSAAATTADAQLYLTGNVSMSNAGGKTETEVAGTTVTNDNDPVNNLNLGAEIGYYFTDNMAFGADLSISHTKRKNAADKKIWNAENMFYINPYFRFDFVTNDKISLGAKAEAVLGFGKDKTNDQDLSKNSALGIAIIPVLNYKFTSNWSAGVSFGNLSYIHKVEKDADNDKNKDIDNSWNCDLSLRTLTFSVVYTF